MWQPHSPSIRWTQTSLKSLSFPQLHPGNPKLMQVSLSLPVLCFNTGEGQGWREYSTPKGKSGYCGWLSVTSSSASAQFTQDQRGFILLPSLDKPQSSHLQPSSKLSAFTNHAEVFWMYYWFHVSHLPPFATVHYCSCSCHLPWLVLRVNLGYGTQFLVKYQSRCCCEGIFTCVTFISVDFEENRLSSKVWVGFIQSDEGLKRKGWGPSRKREFCHRLPLDLRLQHQLFPGSPYG